MILYRARTLASRPRRHPELITNCPSRRISGRWFTSVLDLAIAHMANLHGPSEIIQVDVPDAIAESFRVATTPNTVCGLAPILHSANPDTDYILPMFRVMSAEAISADSKGRVRDMIDINAVSIPKTRYIPMQLPLAA